MNKKTKHSDANIFIFGALFDKEFKEIENFRNNKNVFKGELGTKNIIRYVLEYVKERDNTKFTIYVIANITEQDERIFKQNGFKQSLEDIIHILNQQCYNKHKEYVKFDKETLFQNHEQNETNRNLNIIQKFKELYTKNIGTFPENKSIITFQ